MSISTLSDSLRAPGISFLDTVKEQSSPSNSSSDIDETETPPCEEGHMAVLSTEEETAR